METGPATLFDEAQRLLAAGAFEEAEERLRDVLDDDPQHAAALRYLGLLLLERDQTQEAADCFIRALQLDVEDKEALRGLWRAYAAHDALPQLVPLLTDLVAGHPADAEYRRLLAEAQNAEHRAAEAEAPAALPEEAFDPDPEVRFRALLETASADLQAGRLDPALVTLQRAALTTGYADDAVVGALSDLYRQAQDVPALKALWKRAAVAALERDDLDAFFRHAYTSIYAEQMFARSPRYAYATIDADLNAYVRLAARAHPLAALAGQHRARPRAEARPLRVGFVLEGLSQLQAPSRFYLPVVEHHDPERFELYCYSRYALGEALAVRERYAETAAFMARHRCRVRTPDRPMGPMQQVDALARQILEDQIDVLVFQTLHFVPVYNFLAALRLAPLQALVEHQQPEHTAVADLVFTLRKAALECSAEAAPFPMMHLKPPPGPPVDRSAFGIPAGAVVLASANREARYRQDVFWQAVTDLLERHPNTYFLAIGLADAGPYLAGREHLRDRVVTPGFRTDVMECLAAADVYVDLIPSGGGSSLVEAMYAGLPVVSFEQDFGSLYRVDRETISDYVGEPALVVPHGNLARWHQLLDGLVRDADFRREMGETMRRRARAFDPATATARLFDTLEAAYDRRAQG